MTRIFDALKKVQAAREPAILEPPYPAPPVVPVPPPHPAPAPLHVTRPAASHAGADRPRPMPVPGRFETVEVRELPEDLVRELTTLRIGLEAAVDDRSTRVIVFMSSQGGEGTSTIAAEFAILLASDPRSRTLLLEAHARRPSLAVRFGLDGSAPARRGEGGTLAVFPVTSEAQRRGLVTPTAIRDLLGSSAGAWDWVIIDGPPVLESPEATELATLASGVVIVVESGSTKRHVVTRAVDLLRKAGARVLGSVLNRRRLEIPEFIYRRI